MQPLPGNWWAVSGSHWIQRGCSNTIHPHKCVWPDVLCRRLSHTTGFSPTVRNCSALNRSTRMMPQTWWNKQTQKVKHLTWFKNKLLPEYQRQIHTWIKWRVTFSTCCFNVPDRVNNTWKIAFYLKLIHSSTVYLVFSIKIKSAYHEYQSSKDVLLNDELSRILQLPLSIWNTNTSNSQHEMLLIRYHYAESIETTGSSNKLF